jgi:hypothetical protein
MIQRIQTLWLLLGAIAGFLMTEAPLFKADLANNLTQTVIATDSLWLFAIIMAAAIVAMIAIFLFKKRLMQLRLTVIASLLSIIIVVMEVWKVTQYKSVNTILKGTYQWGGLLPIAMTIFFVLAAKSIYKDEKLVKSLDRLR